MDPVLRTLLLERLRASDIDPAAARVIEAAVEAGGGEDAPAPPPVWLRSVTVEGFRGIGAPATLELDPSPGLTVVVGRNGSGKSSFAEGLELLMTGALKRWEKRPKAWTETWQCLHHDGPTRLRAELVVNGEPVALEQQWQHGAPHDDTSGRGPVQQVLAEHGWDRALHAFRPFLSYAELATMFNTLTSLYDALSPVLGLAEVDELAKQLGEQRLQLDRARRAIADAKDQLVARLDPDDERAALVAAALRPRKVDLDALEELLRETPAYSDDTASLRRLAGLAVPDDEQITDAFTALRVAERAHADAAQTDARRAAAVATLLRAAIALRDPSRLTDDCPVCGTADVLDEAWTAEAARHAAELDEQAQALAEAERDLAAARRRCETLIDPSAHAAPGLARSLGLSDAADFDGLDDADAVRAAAASLRAIAAAAQAELERRDTAWQEVAAVVRRWLDEAREAERRAPLLQALKAAERWVKEQAESLRAERFAPIAERAIANWRELRQGSSVDLHEITLRRVGRGGRADFDVRADGDEANALGVMSQGELLALSVSVFLPRAALDESPFRFAVIDDPVQAMDPAKVDGLARVLHRAARTRQLVVFTHDDRLPEAIRRLRLDATMLHVDRRAGSNVSVRVSRAPVRRYLDGARRYARHDKVPPEVQARVVPMFCRYAVEAAAAMMVRRDAAAGKASLDEADEAIAEARTLRELLALALFGEAGRHGEVGGEVKRRFGAPAASLVTTLNTGAHAGVDRATLIKLPETTQDFIHELLAQ